jgi:hypothetical protein
MALCKMLVRKHFEEIHALNTFTDSRSYRVWTELRHHRRQSEMPRAAAPPMPNTDAQSSNTIPHQSTNTNRLKIYCSLFGFF